MKQWNDLQLQFDLAMNEVEEDARERAISYEEARQISEAARQRFAGEETPAWFQEYLALIEKGWPWRLACYMAWASSPKLLRKPETLTKLATEVLGLTGPRVVYTWRKKFPAIDTTVAMLQAAPLWEHRRDVLEALVYMASRPDYKSFNDRKLFLEMVGDYVPKSQLQLKGSGARDLSELSDEELDQLMGEMGKRPKQDGQDNQDGEGASLAPQPGSPQPEEEEGNGPKYLID